MNQTKMLHLIWVRPRAYLWFPLGDHAFQRFLFRHGCNARRVRHAHAHTGPHQGLLITSAAHAAVHLDSKAFPTLRPGHASRVATQQPQNVKDPQTLKP